MRPYLAAAVLSLAGCFVDTMPSDTAPAATTGAPGTTGGSTALPDPTTTATTALDPGTTTTATSSGDPSTTTTDDATTSTTTTSGATTDDATTGAACIDEGDPSADLENATPLATLGCKDLPATFDGILGAADDVDWYTYRGEWDVACQADPRLAHTLSSSMPIRLCVYVRCLALDAMVECVGASPDMTPEGDPGCCASTAFEMDVSCNGSVDETMDVFLRVDGETPAVCVDYKVGYSYHEYFP